MGEAVYIEDKLQADDGDLKSLIQELMQRVKILEDRVEKLTIENKKLTIENKKLIRENGKLHLENKKLRDKYNHLKNISSRNSSTPPSKDPPYKPNTNKEKPNPKAASRKKDKKKKSNGGQKGHKGFRLEPVENPDKTIFHYLDFTPDGMKLTAKDILRFEERQEFEIPKPKIVVTAHRAAIYKHPITGKLIRAPFPKGLEGQTNYGPNIKAIALNLHVAHLIPLKRTTQVLKDLFGVKMSQGTLVNLKNAASMNLKAFQKEASQALLSAERINCDESGLRVLTKNYWCHIYVSNLVCLFFCHQKRGTEAMLELDILSKYMGKLIVDFFASYRKVATMADLYYCIIHIVRELRSVHDQTDESWAQNLIEHFYDGLEMKDEAGGAVSGKEKEEWIKKFRVIVEEGSRLNPDPPDPPPGKKKRGRKKRTKGGNLVLRLKANEKGYTEFLSDFAIPFTNNDAERPIRMLKVQQKVSGCFREFTSSQQFLQIRGYIETLRKNGKDVFNGIVASITGTVPNLTQITGPE